MLKALYVKRVQVTGAAADYYSPATTFVKLASAKSLLIETLIIISVAGGYADPNFNLSTRKPYESAEETTITFLETNQSSPPKSVHKQCSHYAIPVWNVQYTIPDIRT